MPAAPEPPVDGLPVADPWFDRRAVGDGVTTLLWEPHLAPLLRCNVWHVRGRDRDLLVDTGMGIGSLVAAATDLFDRPLTVVVTHTHDDHLGGAHEFDAVHVHPAEAGVALDPDRLGERLSLLGSAYPPAVRRSLESAGYDVPDLMVDAVPHDGYDPAAFGVRPARRVEPLVEGDVVDLGDRAFEVLHLPGHSPGSIGLWEAGTGTLFSGDAVYDGPLLDDLDGSDVDAYVATMERLRALPVQVVHGGHDPSFGRGRLVEICDAYLAGRRASSTGTRHSTA